jgi:glycerol-3-phosphate dehydrogenase (NAD(P)+)
MMKQARPPVAVLGAGAWGTALAAAASAQGDVVLWGRREQAMATMASSRINAEYLPGIELPRALQYTSDLSHAFAHLAKAPGQGLLVLGTPMAGLPQTCQLVEQALTAGLKIAGLIWICKGLTPDTGKFPHELVTASMAAVLPSAGVLSGPSFAKEVARGLPVALTIASQDNDLKQLVTAVFHSEHMRIYRSSDVMGVEVGGALKNVMATACGISDGLGLGNNARAALITRGLAEMTRFGVALGAKPNTFAGLTGLGDLVLTATGDLSRNRQVGLRIGRGESLADILASGITAEGARCAQAVLKRAQSMGIPMPITEAVCATLYGDVAPAHAVHRLMARSATEE